MASRSPLPASGPSGIVDRLRTRLAANVAEPFGHGRPPLEHTLDHPGDPGLFGPGSVTWEVMGQVTTFIGGIRGLLVQACHPEAVAGVHHHSRYRVDPLGRLSRTAFYVTVTAFGAMPEVEEAVAFVNRRHARVAGVSHRGRPYAASDPALAAWVHNALVDSFLTAHQVYARRPLSPEEADAFVSEQTRVGRLLGASPLPTTAADLTRWIEGHPAIAHSPGLDAAIEFLADPPLSPGQRAGYGLLLDAAVATLPDHFKEVLGVRTKVRGRAGGLAADRLLRWTMGDSPAWQLALQRVAAGPSGDALPGLGDGPSGDAPRRPAPGPSGPTDRRPAQVG